MKNSDLTLKRRLHLLARMFSISWQVRPYAVVGYLLGALVEIGGTIGSIFATAKLGALLAGFISNGQTAGIWFWLWVDIGAVSAIGLGFLAMQYATRMLYFSFVRWNINTFLGSVSRLDISDFDDPTMRNEINRISGSYIWQLSNLSTNVLELIYALMRFLAITVVVAQITWWLIPLIAIFLLPSLVGESRLAKMQWFVWDSKGDFRHIFWGLDYIVRQAKGQMELRSSQAKNYVLKKIDVMNSEFYIEQEGKYRHASRFLVPTKLLEVAGTAIGSVVVLRQLLAHSISLERYFFLSGALLRIGGALNNIFGTLTRLQEPLLLANSYFALADRRPKIVDTDDSKVLPIKLPTIVFENVSFTYPGQTQPVFEKLNLKIEAGEHLALVGENGAGKSTLIKLLLRFYRPTRGKILIDGHDLQDLSIESWYDQLATLFQEFNQYPLPVSENIQIGRSGEKPDHKRLEQAAHSGGVSEMVGKYKYGWETVLDSSFKKGIDPSGGQWQRVALARAFYRDANILILDEPTAAIDAKAEYEIFNNIFKQYQNKTTLIVSHRFSTVRRADRIVVIENGKIVEQGSHKDLMKQNGLYHEMFTKQAEGYRD